MFGSDAKKGSAMSIQDREYAEELMDRLASTPGSTSLNNEASRFIEAQQSVLQGLLAFHDVMPLNGPLSILKDHVEQLQGQQKEDLVSLISFMEANIGPIASTHESLIP